MKHLKLYEDLDRLFQDMKDLDLAKDYKGWWVFIDIPGIALGYYMVISEDVGSAMIRLLDYIGFLSTDETKKKKEINRIYSEFDMDSFESLEEIVHDIDTYIEGDGNIITWSMTLRSEYKKEVKCEKSMHQHNLPKIVKFGRKYFSDFDEILNRNPMGKY